MLIAVLADTHGDISSVCKHLKQWKLDGLLFAGDYYRDGEKIAQTLRINYYGVRGNCDRYESQARDEEIIELMSKRIYLLHGQQYGVKQSISRLYYRALELEVDTVVYGHTHFPHMEKIDKIWMINPGSPSRNRIDSRGSYGLIEIEPDIFKPRLIYL